MAKNIEDIKQAEIVKDTTLNEEQKSNDTKSEGKKIDVKARAKKKSDLATPLIIDIIFLIVGICMLKWPGDILHTISMIIGVIFIAYAAYNAIKYIRIQEKKNSDLPLVITSITTAIAGFFLIFQAGLIEAFFSIIVGIILTISGILNLQDAMTIKTDNKSPLILSIITLICGILCLFGKIMPVQVMIIFIGIVLIIYSLSDIAQSFIVYKKK